jgi:hypothetical protein
MLATVLKNKVMYRQFIQCRFYKLKMLQIFKTLVSLLSGHDTYLVYVRACYPVKIADVCLFVQSPTWSPNVIMFDLVILITFDK